MYHFSLTHTARRTLAYSVPKRTQRVISRAISFSSCTSLCFLLCSPSFSLNRRRCCPLFPIHFRLWNPVIMMRRDKMPARKTPSLVDLCIQKLIDNVRYLGNVGCVDHFLLEQILPHCEVDQLMHVEKASEGCDLSPVTDKLWKRFFEKKFGTKCINEVVQRMREKKVSFKWMQLYEAKEKEMAQNENDALDRIKQLYKKEDARKQSRQVKICTKLPPPMKRRFWADNGPAYNVSNVKSNIMKKSKLDFLKSREVKNIAAMKKNSIQRSNSSSSIIKTGSISRVGSSSKGPQSTKRTF